MKITEVRIFPTESRDGKLKAFATMTFDDWFVVRNVKIIEGNNGLFVAMPSRKAMDSCPKCKFKNARGSKYCNQCGAQLPAPQQPVEEHSGDRGGNHMDIAHPISQECRVYIQEQIIAAYNKETGSKVAETKEATKPASLDAPEEPKQAPLTAPEPEGTGSISPKVDESKDIEL